MSIRGRQLSIANVGSASAVAATILVAAACAKLPVAGSAPKPTRAVAAAAAIRGVESTIRGALARSDTAALVAVLDSGVIFAYRQGASRGRPSVAAAMIGGRLGQGDYRTLVTFDEPERCERGATLGGMYGVTRRQADGDVGVENGAFAIRLVVADTVSRVAEVVFDRSVNAARHRLTRSCRELRTVRLESSRLRVALLPLSASRWNANQTLESELAQRGWTRGAADGPTNDQFGRPHTRSDGAPSMLSTLSVSLVRSLSLELTTQLQPNTGTLTTYNPAAASLLTEHYRARPVSMTLSAGWRFLRVGAGPVLVSSQWTEQYEHLLLDSTTDPPSYRNDFAGRVDSAWSRRSIGATINATTVLPIAGRVFATTMAAARLGTRAALPGVPTHERWLANLDGSYMAAGFGYAW